AEDGIRDYKVTGVQTCALPIYRADPHQAALPVAAEVDDRAVLQPGPPRPRRRSLDVEHLDEEAELAACLVPQHRRGHQHRNGARSEERRVGKECRARWRTSEER